MSRRVAFEDTVLDVKVLVDMPEELFQSLQQTFGKKHLRIFVGTLGQQAIQRSLSPLIYEEENDDRTD